jgi:hypothetical protein
MAYSSFRFLTAHCGIRVHFLRHIAKLFRVGSAKLTVVQPLKAIAEAYDRAFGVIACVLRWLKIVFDLMDRSAAAESRSTCLNFRPASRRSSRPPRLLWRLVRRHRQRFLHHHRRRRNRPGRNGPRLKAPTCGFTTRRDPYIGQQPLAELLRGRGRRGFRVYGPTLNLGRC